ncbi:MAG: Hpt domain-containing protein [Coriobacteriales bacterium]|jgi:HPt (histidine-containing phosphotransfer) domain-containing protein|nr:Hpt domain-containing protein [Coriobacteriales bacterium]
MTAQTPIEGINYEAGLAQYQMEKIYNRILATYLRSAPDLLNALAAFSEAGLQDYITTVHGLKGASYGIQANHIGDLAKELELAGKDGNTDFIVANNQHLIDETNALLERLADFLEPAT